MKMGEFKSCENMTGSRDNAVVNQVIIYTDKGRIFRSYNSNIAFIERNGKTYLDKNKWDYSVTTGKYRNIFLGESKKETEKKIKDGIYILTELND